MHTELPSVEIHQVNEYRVFHGFGQAELGKICLRCFFRLEPIFNTASVALKMALASKVVKSDSKIIICQNP